MRHQRLLGAVLLALGLMALAPGRMIAPAVMWAVALGVYAATSRGRRSAWPLVVFGVLASVAATVTVAAVLPRWNEGVVFLLGMTATFTSVYLLPPESGGARWALWPALAWAFLTLAANDPWGGPTRWILPLVMIGVGVVYLGWSRGRG